MDDDRQSGVWPALSKDDEGLLSELMATLSARVSGDAYSSDGSFAEGLRQLPAGLRAMAATHWLDISLTLDSITWHFGNFGEPGLMAATAEGLAKLGLTALASCFRDARELMVPLLEGRTEEDGDRYEILEDKNLRQVAREIDRRAWDLDNACNERTGRSVIYEAWVHYAREHPERVFPR